MKLTTKPEPYTLDRTLRWVQRQVAPTLKMLKKQIYRKPGVVYWSAGELNKIEASMSGGVGYVEPPGLHITAANYNGKTISIILR